MERLSIGAARRVALAAQGFGRPVPDAVGTRQLNLLLQRLRLLQIDSVNVFERSHHLPVHARLGAYDRSLLDALLLSGRGGYIEEWAHVASFIPVADRPLWGFAHEARRAKDAADPDSFASTHAPLLAWVRDALRAEGPMRASAIEHEGNVRQGPWWGWSDVKIALEVLFRHGEVATAGRVGFERVYALPEQVLPVEVRERMVPRAEAEHELIRRAIRALGVGTVGDVADYFRLPVATAKRVLRELAATGEVRPVEVEGWSRPAYLQADQRVPRRLGADALLSPFDPMVWERDRALRLFGFHYRIEIYTPAPKRVFGYYTLPVLVDDRLVGRVDLKSDRQARVLRVQSAWREEGVGDEVAERVAVLVDRARAWQGLDTIEVVDRGDLAAALRASVKTLVE